MKKAYLFRPTAFVVIPIYFMSMLGVGLLNEIIVEGGETNSAEILDKLRAKIIKSLAQTGENQRKDGMDISLCVLNLKDNILQYSGAYNPLYILRKNTDDELELYDRKLEEGNYILFEIKADKMPIGKFQREENFKSTEIKLNKNDTIYSFSDGYQDQFGGLDGKKFMSRKLKKLILSIQEENMQVQLNILDNRFEEWLKEGFSSQIDDVCMVGVRV